MKKTKEDLYQAERLEIFTKIIKIIGISKEKKRFNRKDLETDEFKQQINDLLPDIKKYYKTSSWRSMKTWKDMEINLVNNIFQFNGVEIIKTNRKKKGDDNIFHNYREYIYDINDELLNNLI